MEELRQIKALMDRIDDAINYYQESCADKESKEKFCDMGCELKCLLCGYAEQILHDSMYARD